jgi:DNA-binding SARP family transcriptional activator
MEFGILGPLEVHADGQAIPVPGHRQRCLLAYLLLHANQIVASERLVDQLWPDEAPEPGAAALQACVSRLRKALGRGAKYLETAAPGYVLQVDADGLDVRRFERLLEQANEADPASAAETLREALALWRGPALADLAYESFAQAPIARLDELRLLALGRRCAADLALGRHAQLVAELEALVAEHPLREGLRGQLMLALYRAGRQADALEQYQSARGTLVDELGIEPGPALQELERKILRHDASLELGPDRAPSRSILAAAFPHQRLDAVLMITAGLARRPAREVIVARLLDDPRDLTDAAAAAGGYCASLVEGGLEARAAVFTTSAPGADTSRLATEQDVDLVIVPGAVGLLDDPGLVELLDLAPCDVAIMAGDEPALGPVLVPFAGAEHDWCAIELGAWLAAGWEVPLRLAGPTAEGQRDSSRVLASASLAVQRALGVAVEPLLVDPGSAALVDAAGAAAIAVIGLSSRWRREGLGEARGGLVRSGRPTLLVRKGLRPGGLAPTEHLTRFTWSLRTG